MEVVVVEDVASGAGLVADAIARLLKARPRAVLGFATGSSPEPVYRELVARRRSGRIDPSGIRGFSLDEYVGLPEGHPAAYRSVIRRQVVDPLGLPPDAVSAPDGQASDIPAACASYERAIVDAGGIDLQLVGIGGDGHIGFNEPGSSLGSRTRLKTLTDQTRVDNARFFDGDVDAVPRHVITQGIGTILEARHIVFLAWGKGKARAVARAVEGPVTAMVPASVLQLHPHVTAVVDRGGAEELELRPYYESVFAAKPAWQGL